MATITSGNPKYKQQCKLCNLNKIVKYVYDNKKNVSLLKMIRVVIISFFFLFTLFIYIHASYPIAVRTKQKKHFPIENLKNIYL